MNTDTDHASEATEMASRHMSLARSALQQYAIDVDEIAFIQHNAGVVFRVTTTAHHQYLLKIHKRVGAGDNPSPAQLEPGLKWLNAMSQTTDVVVQKPVPTRNGPFVAQVADAPAATPLSCTLQRWIDGDPPHGDFTQDQAHQLGRMTGKLHAWSSSYGQRNSPTATYHDAQSLHTNIALLLEHVPQLSTRDVALITAAEQRIAGYMQDLGRDASVWGPVHGDLHYDNVLIYGNEIRPIDFDGLRLAHYLYDLGVTVYHTYHQGAQLRHALFAGYQQTYALPAMYQHYVEGFVAYAAIDNVAWNCTIPEQLQSPYFHKNLDHLVNRYCLAIAQGQHFLFS